MDAIIHVHAKYQCTLYTVREALPHLPAVRVSAGVFHFVFIQTGLAADPPTACHLVRKYCRSSDGPF